MPRDFETKINAKRGVQLPSILSANALGTDSLGNVVVGGAAAARPSARGYRTTTQSIPNAAWTPIEFDNEDHDSDTIHNSSAWSRFVCKTAGLYLCDGTADLAAAGGGLQRVCGFYVTPVATGTSTFFGLSNHPFSASVNTFLSSSAFIKLAVSDYIQFVVYQDSGAALNLAMTSVHTVSCGIALVS